MGRAALDGFWSFVLTAVIMVGQRASEWDRRDGITSGGE